MPALLYAYTDAVGEENYRYFLLFVFVQFAMCVYATVLLALLFRGEIQDKKLWEVTFFDRSSGDEFKADYFIVFQYLFHRHLYEAGMLAVTGVMSVALAGFLGYHMYITSLGMTTNEHYKWGDVKRWHKDEVKKYKQYLKDQQKQKKGDKNDGNKKEPPTNGNKKEKSQSKPHSSSNGDLGCTGAKALDHSDKKTEREENDDESGVIEDPGRMPANIYNRGLIENWKEVLFPKSLQRRAANANAIKSKSM